MDDNLRDALLELLGDLHAFLDGYPGTPGELQARIERAIAQVRLA